MTTFSRRPKAIFLMGPTASNKTSLALKLRQYLPVEIISVDSALVYRGMNIGTAKPSVDELANVPYRLIDIRDPTESYSVINFCLDATKEMQKITQSNCIPLLVGGTMFYFKALLEGLSPLPQSNFEVRAYIQGIAQALGWESLHEQLKIIDPVSAKRIHVNDLQRLSRALEVFLISGKSLTTINKKVGKALEYQVYQFAIAPCTRKTLHYRIEHRFHEMLSAGFEQEVGMLFARKDIHSNMPSIRCVGYRQMWSYLSKEISYNEMIFRGICATRQLAKRQMTWLKKWSKLHWLNSEELIPSIEKILHVVSV